MPPLLGRLTRGVVAVVVSTPRVAPRYRRRRGTGAGGRPGGGGRAGGGGGGARGRTGTAGGGGGRPRAEDGRRRAAGGGGRGGGGDTARGATGDSGGGGGRRRRRRVVVVLAVEHGGDGHAEDRQGHQQQEDADSPSHWPRLIGPGPCRTASLAPVSSIIPTGFGPYNCAVPEGRPPPSLPEQRKSRWEEPQEAAAMGRREMRVKRRMKVAMCWSTSSRTSASARRAWRPRSVMA